MRLPREYMDRFKALSPPLHRTLECLVAMRKVGIMGKIPFFQGVVENKPWSKLGLLGAIFKFEDFATGDLVCRQGDPSDRFYVIVHGKVAVEVLRDGEQVQIDQLANNAYFGEIALLKNQPRICSVRCETDCLLMSVTRENFNKLLEIAPEICDEFQHIVTERTSRQLRTTRFFGQVIKENKPWSKIALLSSFLQYYTAEEGEVILREGDERSRFYYMVSGHCECLVTGPDGTQSVVDRVKAEQFFGEMSMLEDRRCNATVRAVRRSQFITMDKKTFTRLLSIAPEVRGLIMAKAAERKARLGELGVPEQATFQPLSGDLGGDAAAGRA